ncbi:MAG TPA: M48 family metallopeptidase [Vicinamibacterales bacterium]|nr:M48 family metallopeptidase [Vicinamibacterales bacterium]
MSRHNNPRITAAVVSAFVAAASLAAAQTKITAPKNKYTVQQDVQLGREAAAEVEKQMPMLRDGRVDDYVERVGERLVRHIPREFHHDGFRYTFAVVNLREINAFALPGGPMYAHRGMLEKAKTEGEIAGVLAHEISHVALRHGTAQASKAGKYQLGQIGSAILGAIIGGTAGEVVSAGGQLGFGAAFLRYSREYERQADILGAQIMARAGYDPRDMASMFRTIEQEGGGRAPEWLSNHPNPGNRAQYITREAQMLRVENPVRDTQDFQAVQARLAQMPPAPSTEEVARNRGSGRGAPSGGSTSRPSGRVEAPSSRYTTYNEGNIFRISVPSNWREMASENSVTFAPDGGYGTIGNQSVFTHGVQAGILRNERHGLEEATDELIAAFAQSNPRLARAGSSTRGTLGGRAALRTALTNISEATGGRERIELYTAQMRDGTLFYLVGVSPEEEFRTYQPVINRVAGSIQFLR